MTMLLLFAAAAVAVPKPGDLKTFKDWTVGCDNGRVCHMTSLMPENGDWDASVSLALERGPEPTAVPAISITAGDPGQPAALFADGRKLPARVLHEKEDAILPADVPAVIAALRNGTELDIRDAKGASLGKVSLAGASAALLYIDDAQKRVGTVTALARPGNAPPSSVPPPPALPSVRSASVPGAGPIPISASQLAKVRKDHGCIPEEKDWPGYDAETHAIDADHSLILMGCGAGAYNFSAVPLIATRSAKGVDIRTAEFDLNPTLGESGDPMLVNADWVPNEGLLTSFAKGRGIGDCGVGSDYAWDGSRFRLVMQIEMGECRGSMDYITTWRAKVVR